MQVNRMDFKYWFKKPRRYFDEFIQCFSQPVAHKREVTIQENRRDLSDSLNNNNSKY